MIKKLLNITVANGLTPPDNTTNTSPNNELTPYVVIILIAGACLTLLYILIDWLCKKIKTKNHEEHE